jgi:hypothetical protein
LLKSDHVASNPDSNGSQTIEAASSIAQKAYWGEGGTSRSTLHEDLFISTEKFFTLSI